MFCSRSASLLILLLAAAVTTSCTSRRSSGGGGGPSSGADDDDDSVVLDDDDDDWGSAGDGLFEGTGSGSFATSDEGNLDLAIDVAFTVDDDQADGWISADYQQGEIEIDCGIGFEGFPVSDEPQDITVSCDMSGPMNGEGGTEEGSLTLRWDGDDVITGTFNATGSSSVVGSWVWTLEIEARD